MRLLRHAFFLTAFALTCHAENALTPAQVLNYRRVTDLQLSPDGSKLLYVVYNYQWDWQPHLSLLDIATGASRELTPAKKSERMPQWSPDGKMLAFLSNRDGRTQVYTAKPDGSDVTAITARKYGVTSFHWSPDGVSIAYLAKDDSAPASDSGPQVADRDSDLSRLWVTGLTAGTNRAVGKTGYRIDEFQWQNSSQILVVATHEPAVEEFRDAVYRISISDGAIALVARPPQPFRALQVSPDGKQYAVRSTRANGPTSRDLFLGTLGRDDLHDISALPDRPVADVKWRPTAMWLRVVDGFHNRIWRFTAKAAPVPIDLPHSVDTFDVSREGVLVYAGGDFDHPSEVYVRAKNGGLRQLTHLQQNWDGIHLAPAKIFWTKSFDGTPIESALIRPTAAQQGEQVPLVLMVHGGPASNFSANYTWETAWAQLLAAHGYAVLMVNPRGSNGYSEDFEKANRGDLGGGDYKDLIAVVDHVISQGDIDPNRLGIGGWSYGGEMSEWAITQTRRFKAAVAGAGVFDQQAEFETEEGPADDEWQFLGTPWERPEVFARNSPATYIGNAHTPTLIFDGEEDTANPVGQSKGLYRALKHLGVETQLVLYPGEGHSPRNGSYNIDMFERLLNWYDRFVKTAN
jgi:dipeptidyl aminopeptidase/acylaminoacyl peptidase